VPGPTAGGKLDASQIERGGHQKSDRDRRRDRS
jgi:hypothetical protein